MSSRHGIVDYEEGYLDGQTQKMIDDMIQLLCTDYRIGTANSDVNAVRYAQVHQLFKRHGEAMRETLREMGWRA